MLHRRCLTSSPSSVVLEDRNFMCRTRSAVATTHCTCLVGTDDANADADALPRMVTVAGLFLLPASSMAPGLASRTYACLLVATAIAAAAPATAWGTGNWVRPPLENDARPPSIVSNEQQNSVQVRVSAYALSTSKSYFKRRSIHTASPLLTGADVP